MSRIRKKSTGSNRGIYSREMFWLQTSAQYKTEPKFDEAYSSGNKIKVRDCPVLSLLLLVTLTSDIAMSEPCITHTIPRNATLNISPNILNSSYLFCHEIGISCSFFFPRHCRSPCQQLRLMHGLRSQNSQASISFAVAVHEAIPPFLFFLAIIRCMIRSVQPSHV